MIFEGTKKSIFFGLGLTRAGQPLWVAVFTRGISVFDQFLAEPLVFFSVFTAHLLYRITVRFVEFFGVSI